MAVQLTVYTVPLVLSAVLSAVLGVALWRTLDGPLLSSAGGISLVQFAVSLWALGQAVALWTSVLELQVAGFLLSDLGISVAGLSWLVFALEYTGRQAWLTRRRFGIFAGAMTVSLLVGVTTVPYGFHETFYVGLESATGGAAPTAALGTGPVRWLFAVVIYAVNMTGNYFVFQKFLASRNVYRKRAFVLILGDVVVLVCAALSLTGYSPVPGMALSPLVYVLVVVLSLLILVSYRTLRYIPLERALSLFGSRSKNLAPAARDVIMEEIDSGVLVLDHDDRVVDVNPLGRAILGADDDRIVGKDFRDVVPASLFVDADDDFVEGGVTAGTYTGIWIDPPAGERVCFDVSVTPLENGDGDVTGRVLLIHDVTDREQRKQKLEERTTELERQNEQLDDFASIVSHDLRNPLNVAKGSIDLAERKDDEEFYQKVRDAHDRMEDIIEDVLTMARQGQTIDETESVELAAVVEAAWNNVGTKDATLELAVDATVQADRNRLVQAFENWIRNAIEHGRDDVTITVGGLEGGFYVADDGPGIPEKHRDSVLEQGYTTSDSGTGFGLAIINTVVDAHGWDVAVTESESGGARFDVTGVYAGGQAASPGEGGAAASDAS
jgi:PAS domain S-box-containing protein